MYLYTCEVVGGEVRVECVVVVVTGISEGRVVGESETDVWGGRMCGWKCCVERDVVRVRVVGE